MNSLIHCEWILFDVTPPTPVKLLNQPSLSNNYFCVHFKSILSLQQSSLYKHCLPHQRVGDQTSDTVFEVSNCSQLLCSVFFFFTLASSGCRLDANVAGCPKPFIRQLTNHVLQPHQSCAIMWGRCLSAAINKP